MSAKRPEVWVRAASVRSVWEFAGPGDEIKAVLQAIRPVSESSPARAFEVGISGEAVCAMRSPCVYLLWRGERCIYVGMSTVGLSRPLSGNHHAIGLVEPEDYLQVFFVPADVVGDLEWWLIRLLKPEKNGRGAYEYRDGALRLAGRNKWVCGWRDCSADANYRVERPDGLGYWCCEAHMGRWQE